MAYEEPDMDELPMLELTSFPSPQERSIIIVESDVANGADQEEEKVVSHEHLWKSGALGKCHDPFCTTCPPLYDAYSQPLYSGTFHQSKTIGRTKKRRVRSFLIRIREWGKFLLPGILNPHTRLVQQWNKFFAISSLFSIFLDPLFFFLLSVQTIPQTGNLCIVLNHEWAVAFTVLRTISDSVYLLNMLLQFRLAYLKKGSGELVDDPKAIARHYLRGFFLLDLITVLPLPQIILNTGAGANSTKSMLRVTVLLQNIPRSIRFFPLLAGRSPNGFVFETAWANFVINILIYLLAGHVVGSCWYLFSLQRVNVCLQGACKSDNSNGLTCDIKYLDCGIGGTNYSDGNNSQAIWLQNTTAGVTCLSTNTSPGFAYGIYSPMGYQIVMEPDGHVVQKYIYSLCWGFLQVSTLAGNLVPSMFVWEVLFTMGIVGLGLLMFALFIGNMQNFLQSLTRRKLEMQLRRYDVENWMGRRNLPLNLRKRVREVERFKWAATRGVDEKELLGDLPEDLQREIQRLLCLDLVKKVRLFTVMDEEVLDAICERLHQRLYIEGSMILGKNNPVERMLFIVRGNLCSTGEDGSVMLSAGGFCGEELLIWHLEQASNIPGAGRTGAVRRTGRRAVSSRTVTALNSVEVFALEAEAVKYVTTYYSSNMRTARVRGVLRNESPSWQSWAAVCIQVAWRYRKRQLEVQSARSQQAMYDNQHTRLTSDRFSKGI